jgi:flagellar protein FlgJ
MSVDLSICQPARQATSTAASAANPPAATPEDQELRKTFDSFLGEVFFGQMLKAMRKTVGKPAYFDGGQTEAIFTQQLDQVLAEKLAETTAPKFSGPMFELFSMRRS